MDDIAITITGITEFADGSKSIRYSVRTAAEPGDPCGYGGSVKLGGTIVINVAPRLPHITVESRSRDAPPVTTTETPKGD